MNEEVAPATPGWYPSPEATEGRREVGYWNGTAWTGEKRRATSNGRGPRDMPGRVAVFLLCAGFVCTIGVSVLFSVLTVPNGVAIGATLVILAATPVALILSIMGLARAHQHRYTAPMSLVGLILSVLATVFLALPIALFVTGVWVVPHI